MKESALMHLFFFFTFDGPSLDLAWPLWPWVKLAQGQGQTMVDWPLRASQSGSDLARLSL